MQVRVHPRMSAASQSGAQWPLPLAACLSKGTHQKTRAGRVSLHHFAMLAMCTLFQGASIPDSDVTTARRLTCSVGSARNDGQQTSDRHTHTHDIPGRLATEDKPNSHRGRAQPKLPKALPRPILGKTPPQACLSRV